MLIVANNWKKERLKRIKRLERNCANMLTDMAPTATAAGQFYGSQIQTMGITNLAPHIQKAVSITGMTKNEKPVPWWGFHVNDSSCRRDIWKASARVTNIRNEYRNDPQRDIAFNWMEIMNASKIWCRNQCSIMFLLRSLISFIAVFLWLLGPGWKFGLESVNHRSSGSSEDSCGSVFEIAAMMPLV